MKSEDIEAEDRKEPARSAKSWLKFIRIAQRNRHYKRHKDDARAAWAEYELSSDRPEGEDVLKGFPVYWSSSKGFEPELLSRKPTVLIKKTFEIQDGGIATTAELLLERLAKYHLEHGDFMDAMESARGDFIHADKAAPQVIYESKTRKKKVNLSKGDDGYYSDDGLKYEGEALEGEGGAYYESDELEAYDQKVYLAALPYDQVLHTPSAKSWREVKELCIKFCLTKDEVRARFKLSEEEFQNLPWGKQKDEDDSKSGKAEESYKEYLEGWECYDLASRETCWVVEGHAKELDCKSDEEWYGLRNFFPVPRFAIGSRPAKHLYPTPAYVQLEPVIKELHSLQERKFNLIDGLRRRALVNDSIPGLLRALNSARDNDFIGVAELDSIVEKGGLEAHVLFIPLRELSECLREILELTQVFKDLFYELWGYPDILRGEGDPVETATSVKVKHSGAQNRFKYIKAQFAELGREALEMMCDLSLRVFTDEKLGQVLGYEHLEPQHQQNFIPALELLRNDEERSIRLEFETDSTSFIDEAYQNETRFQVASTLINGVEKIAQLASQPVTQNSVSLALKSLLTVLSGFKGGKDFENDLRMWGDSIIQDLNAPPPQNPGPDIEQMKLDLQAQKQSFEAQARTRELEQEDIRLQLEAEKTRADQALETYKAQTEQRIADITAMVEQSRVQVESYKAQIQDAKRQGDEQKAIADIQQQRAELEVTAAKGASEIQIEREKLETERRINDLYAALEQQRIANEEWEAKFSLMERMMEERRLAEEVRQNAVSQQLQSIQAPMMAQAPQLPPINIQVDASKSGKRVGRIIRDELGNSTIEVEEHTP